MKKLLIRLFCTKVRKRTYPPFVAFSFIGDDESDDCLMFLKNIEVNLFGLGWVIIHRYIIDFYTNKNINK